MTEYNALIREKTIIPEQVVTYMGRKAIFKGIYPLNDELTLATLLLDGNLIHCHPDDVKDEPIKTDLKPKNRKQRVTEQEIKGE